MNIIVFLALALLHVNFVYSYICPIPDDTICPDASKVKFYLYTKDSSTYTQVSTGQLAGVTLNAGCPVVFIAHGYKQNGFMPWVLDMITAFFKAGCFNIISVDWSEITSTTSYYKLATDVNLVYPYTALRTCCSGEHVGAFIVDLNKALGVSFAEMHFVGHSLGAHLGGCAGQYVKSQTGSEIGRVTGMDPAGPMFTGIDTNCRLSPDDATFVDCIHTDTGLFGYLGSLGDVDFYPNGGTNQPGCPSTQYENPLICSHCFSYILFTESLSNNGFVSRSCDSYLTYEAGLCATKAKTIMGYNVYKNATGDFYLDTLCCPSYAKNGALNTVLG